MNGFQDIEIFGQIIGCYGDPSNTDTNTGGIEMTTALDSVLSISGDDRDKKIFWSRVLLCELLIPALGTTAYSRLALVLRPRNLWLFKGSGSEILDFYGNSFTTEPLMNDKIIDIYPRYNLGDVIRVGILPRYITVNGWDEGFSTRITPSVNTSLTLSSLSLANGVYNFGVTDLSTISFYDKNVDSRSRMNRIVYVKVCPENEDSSYLPVFTAGKEVALEDVPENALIIG